MRQIGEAEIVPAVFAEVSRQVVVLLAQIMEPADAACFINKSPGIEMAVAGGSRAALDGKPGRLRRPRRAEEGEGLLPRKARGERRVPFPGGRGRQPEEVQREEAQVPGGSPLRCIFQASLTQRADMPGLTGGFEMCGDPALRR